MHFVWSVTFFTVRDHALTRWFNITIAVRLLQARVHRPPRPTLSGGVVIDEVAFRCGSPACPLGLLFTIKLLSTYKMLRSSTTYLSVTQPSTPAGESLSSAAGTPSHLGCHHRYSHLHYTATLNYQSGHPQLIGHSLNRLRSSPKD